MGMKLLLRLLAISLAACGVGFAAPVQLDPYVGYAYPAGGQQGTKFTVTLRGQRLRNADGIYVTGKGIIGEVKYYEGGSGPLNQRQQDELKKRIQAIRSARTGRPIPEKTDKTKPDAVDSKPVALPDLPELRNLEQKTPKQLQAITDRFLNNAKRPKPPIAEMVIMEVTIDKDAEPGDRELRLRTPAGLSNPIVFQVGQVPEVCELPKDSEVDSVQPAQPPVVCNGQIMPGQTDLFPLQLKGGQLLEIDVEARKLIPYLADAVPGWCQAVVALYDPEGREIAFGDDNRLDSDPVVNVRIPRDGKYTLAIRDALYRGREDFVYRASVREVTLPQSSEHTGMYYTAAAESHFRAKENGLQICTEKEPNDSGATAAKVTLPSLVMGRISKPGDRDLYAFTGSAGDQVVAEVYARRMGSVMDSVLKLLDSKGREIASNDDFDDMESGLITHQADSYLTTKLPANGQYYVQITDAQGHSGADCTYSVRISSPIPDFALRIAPSSINVPAGHSVMATVYVSRKDGWDGDINLSLKDAPSGFSISGGTIPKGLNKVKITLNSPYGVAGNSIEMHMEGSAKIDGKTITRPVIPAEDKMQAFAYRHLVTSQQLVVTVKRGQGVTPKLNLADGERLEIPSGGAAQVGFSVGPNASIAPVKLELFDPPAGITLQAVKIDGRWCILTIGADDKHVGYADNLIIEASADVDLQKRAGGKAGQKQSVSLGDLPAIPFKIVNP